MGYAIQFRALQISNNKTLHPQRGFKVLLSPILE